MSVKLTLYRLNCPFDCPTSRGNGITNNKIEKKGEATN